MSPQLVSCFCTKIAWSSYYSQYSQYKFCYVNKILQLIYDFSGIEIKYLVDFDPQLGEIISETKYMEQLGFHVPELARNVALQVSDCRGLWFKSSAPKCSVLGICFCLKKIKIMMMKS